MDILGYGDAAMLIRFAGSLDMEMTRRVVAATARLDAAALDGVVEVVPAERSILVHYDPLAPASAATAHGMTPLEALRRRIEQLLADDSLIPTASPRRFEIPVCYGGELGPDLSVCAELLGLDEQELIDLHCGADYTVAMIGFLPGFPYLSGLPSRLALPRLESPRRRVPAGSVAIGGTRSGIYPIDAPGGWRLIGRSRVELFDADRKPPALLAPGDIVRFRSVSREELVSSETVIMQ